ncbi:MAG: hypothetical protein J5640_02195 [Bacteroidales bacterium]|nr:hypothetical protein [Bacteroidales bacterium]
MISSCGKDSTGPDSLDAIEVQLDSSRFSVRFQIVDNIAETPHAIRRLDLYIYDADGIKPLLDKRRYESVPESVVVHGNGKARIIVAIANSPGDFGAESTGRFDAIEMLSVDFASESSAIPVMSGMCTVEAGDTETICLTPLMARIRLGEVCNRMKNYVRLEDPRIYLENLNTGAEIMRVGGFRPSSIAEKGAKATLPCDIGIFAQHPGTEVFCYPNDSSETTIGTPGTKLIFECEIKGETCQFIIDLPAIRRNSTTTVDLTVSGKDDFESKVY